MNTLTRQIMHSPHLRGTTSGTVDHAVAKLIATERPQDALFGVEGQSVFEKFESFTAFRHSLIVNPISRFSQIMKGVEYDG